MTVHNIEDFHKRSRRFADDVKTYVEGYLPLKKIVSTQKLDGTNNPELSTSLDQARGLVAFLGPRVKNADPEFLYGVDFYKPQHISPGWKNDDWNQWVDDAKRLLAGAHSLSDTNADLHDLIGKIAQGTFSAIEGFLTAADEQKLPKEVRIECEELLNKAHS